MTQHKESFRLSFPRWRVLLALLLALAHLSPPVHDNASANTALHDDDPPATQAESDEQPAVDAANDNIFLPLVTNGKSTVASEQGVETLLADMPSGIDARLAQAGHTTFWVILKEQADLRAASAAPDWEARGRFVYDRLVTVANRTQSGLRTLLQQRNADFTPYWLVNTVRVKGDQALREVIAALPEVAAILPDQLYQIPQPTPGTEQLTLNAVEWNIDRVNAPQVWSTFGTRGEGIVVANIDSGVQFDHPALVRQYRGALGGGSFDHHYNWFDPANVCGNPSLVPCDNNGHGTHTMGTMVGEEASGVNQIGVAPGARWIAVKGCETIACSTASLLAAGQWVLAPTDLNGQNPRPDLRPHIVNNSWGGTGGDLFYQATVDAWVAAGIFPAFSNGNSGPGCSSAGSPGDNIPSYSSGAFDINNTIAGFSSRGASLLGGEIKPNIAAPGVNVRSSLPTNSYTTFNGTSMASPHTAATVALIWSAAPVLVGDVAQTRALLDQTAIDVADLTCGGTAADNNVWGEGRLDAFAAVDQSPRGSTGTLAGTISDGATGAAITGTTISVSGPTTRTVTINASGQYTLRLLLGTYSVTVRAFGYFEQSFTGVVIHQDQTTTQNAALVSMPRGILQGTVTDAASGAPLAGATVDAAGAEGMLTTQTDGNGHYLFPNPPTGVYTVMAGAFGYFDQTASGVVIHENQSTTQNLVLSTTGEWTTTGAMSGQRSSHITVRLNDGRVVVTGGNFTAP
jgi:subtilisin family serine protease